jgi:TIR domain
VSSDAPPGHAFISYDHEDSQEVDRLRHALETAGIRVWSDIENIWPGQDRRQAIQKAITDNALAFIACFSKNSLNRKTSPQNEELTTAINVLRDAAQTILGLSRFVLTTAKSLICPSAASGDSACCSGPISSAKTAMRRWAG